MNTANIYAPEYDERHDKMVTVTILDLKTGDTATNNEFSGYYWAEGNGHCDCNRSLLFDDGEDIARCGRERFLIVWSDSTCYSISELNRFYKPDYYSVPEKESVNNPPATENNTARKTIRAMFVGGSYNNKVLSIPSPPAPEIRVAALVAPKPTFVRVDKFSGEFDYGSIKEAGKVIYEVYKRDREMPALFHYSHLESIP